MTPKRRIEAAASAAEEIAAEEAPALVVTKCVSHATPPTVATTSGRKTRSSRARVEGPESRRSGKAAGPAAATIPAPSATKQSAVFRAMGIAPDP